MIGLGSGTIGTVLVLVSPNNLIDGTNALFFGRALGSDYFFVNVPFPFYLLSVVVEVVIVVGVILRRFARLTI